jgi:hypothetical protein
MIIALTLVRQSEDQLRLLILDTTQRDSWTVQIEAVDSPPVGLPAPDVDQAVTHALRDRADLQVRIDLARDPLRDLPGRLLVGRLLVWLLRIGLLRRRLLREQRLRSMSGKHQDHEGEYDSKGDGCS